MLQLEPLSDSSFWACYARVRTCQWWCWKMEDPTATRKDEIRSISSSSGFLRSFLQVIHFIGVNVFHRKLIRFHCKKRTISSLLYYSLQRHNKFCVVIIFSQPHKQAVYLGKIFWTQFDCMTENYLENSELLTVVLHKDLKSWLHI